MSSVTGLASVAGGGGRTIPLPPFTSEGRSAAKTKLAIGTRKKKVASIVRKVQGDVMSGRFYSGPRCQRTACDGQCGTRTCNLPLLRYESMSAMASLTPVCGYLAQIIEAWR